MKRLLLSFAITLLVSSQQSWAGLIITDTVIAKDGREWAQADLFKDKSWLTLNRQCPNGVCAVGSTINGYDLDGWAWASIQEVQDLFNAYTGLSSTAPSFYAEINSTWAPDFLSDFRPTSGVPGISGWVHGWSSSLQPSTSGYTGVMFNSEPGSGPFPEDQVETDIAYLFTDSHWWLGGWFWREPQSIATPATLPLLGLGLAALAVSHRKYKWHR
jgi:hypothetical protein